MQREGYAAYCMEYGASAVHARRAVAFVWLPSQPGAALPFRRTYPGIKRRIENVVRGCPEEYREAGFYNAELNGIADSITIIVKNIAKKEEQRKEAEYTSFHDSMTGLYNRRFFSEELRRLDVKRNYPLCIICCDVNGLKLVNDVFGHDVGDQLICRVAESLAGVMQGRRYPGPRGRG